MSFLSNKELKDLEKQLDDSPLLERATAHFDATGDEESPE